MAAKSQKDPSSHPSQDGTGRFPMDALLRSHGFRIRCRCSGQEAIWEWAGHLYSHSDALSYMEPDALKGAQTTEKLYYEQILQ